MLRRVARVLRVGLLIVGLLFLGWFLASFSRWTQITSTWPKGGTFLRVRDGIIDLQTMGEVTDRRFAVKNTDFWTTRDQPLGYVVKWKQQLPRFYRGSNGVGGTSTQVGAPLWLLALLCLAWPVTSFIIRRRRNKRGFPVEPKLAGDSVNTSAS